MADSEKEREYASGFTIDKMENGWSLGWVDRETQRWRNRFFFDLRSLGCGWLLWLRKGMTGTMTTLANRLRILSMRVPDLDANLLEDAASELEKLAADLVLERISRSFGAA